MIWVVALTAYASAYCILVTNGWLKNPVGFAMVDGKAVAHRLRRACSPTRRRLSRSGTSFFGALLTAGFFVAGVSAYHLMRRHPDVEFFRRSIRIGMLTVIVSLMPSVVFGGVQMPFMEPSGVETDPPALAQVAFGFMAFDWFVMSWFALGFMVIFFVKPLLLRARVVHWLIIAAIPLPYFAMILGWLTRELARQPWAVLGILRTEDAVAPLSPGAAQLSFVCFVSLFAVLASVNFWLLARHARRGPEVVRLGAAGEAALPCPPRRSEVRRHGNCRDRAAGGLHDRIPGAGRGRHRGRHAAAVAGPVAAPERRTVIAAFTPFVPGERGRLVAVAGHPGGAFPGMEHEPLVRALATGLLLLLGRVVRDAGSWWRGAASTRPCVACAAATTMIVAGSWALALRAGRVPRQPARRVGADGSPIAAVSRCMDRGFARLRLPSSLQHRAVGRLSVHGRSLAGLGAAAGARLDLGHAVAGPSSLKIVTVFVLVMLPLMLGAQALSWWTFRARVKEPGYL